MRRAIFPAALLLLAGCVRPVPVVTPPIVYPRVATYAWLRGNGSPLAPGGIIDTAAVLSLARYDVVSIDPYRYGTNAQALRLLRSEMTKRRGTLLLAFVGTSKFHVCGDGWFFGEPIYGCDTTQIAYSRARAVQHFDALLYGRNGPYLGGGWIDFGKPGLAEALADTAVAWMPAGWQGIFSDESCLGIGWTQNYGDTINYRRAGFATLAAWDSAYRAGVERYFARLRLRLGSRLIVGNCGPVGSRIANGWMRENFPWQNGGTWESNMLGHPGVPADVGYLGDETAYAKPTLNWLTAWAQSGDPRDPYNQGRARFTLASATLAGGVGVLTWSPTDVARGLFSAWWDEYAVGPDGASTDSLSGKGWLGRPLGPPYRHLGTWRRDFDHGAVLVNPGPQAVKLGGLPGLWRIRGVLAPSVNYGRAADGTVLPAGDGLFLWRRR